MTYSKELVSRTYFVDEVQWLRSEAGGTVYSKTIHTLIHHLSFIFLKCLNFYLPIKQLLLSMSSFNFIRHIQFCCACYYDTLYFAVLDVHVYVLWIVFRNLSEDDVEMCSLWSDIPESLLLQIFSYLDARSLVSIAQTCKVKLFHDIMLKLCKEW